MAGAKITIEPLGLDEVRETLGRMADAGQDLTPAMRDIGEHLLRTTRDRFRTERDPDGAQWQPLTDATKKRKRKNAHRIGTEDGNLSGQLAYRAAPDEVMLGSPLVYAGTFHFGAKKGAYGSTSRGSPIPWGDIPARPFVGLSGDDRIEILVIIRDHFLKEL